MKLLKDILYKARLEQVVGHTNIAIEQLSFDSRTVVPFTAFVAVKGTRTDGHAHIAQAVENGATAVICERMPEERRPGVTYVRVPDSANALAIAADNFFDHPSRKLKLVGVTGTNGKTSVTTLLHRLFRALGRKTGLISTVEVRIGQEVLPTTHTTPDAIRLNELLARMVEERCTHCFMEVSSHAVVQERVTGLHFDVGVFTNITHDHLDYHGSFAEYIKAKKRFFDMLGPDACALVNADDANSTVMVQNTRAARRSFAVAGMADHRARIVENQLSGLHLNIDGHDVYTRLVGGFNASNLLAVYSTALILGEAPLNVLTALSDLTPPVGRFQVVRGKGGVIGIVDYAHTPDALRNVLTTIREVCAQGEKVIGVLGCGGDRDREKRPMMARLAAAHCDAVVLTSDNPRSEDPSAIIEEMRGGLSATDQQRTYVNVDRREAIRQAVGLAGPGDVVLVAGKGHEAYQEIAGVRHPFDDAAVLKETLELMHK
ncbi:MAG: UDP-N-acetylmuramoyl-L-alanyl-D-glutamate--2,6-diaminopimelate ligase [Flavobacteriales bacterium]|nr:UDP-N-acetylmuramoyl-L-alanyl-D-glutamate--2,6-diaminopimelate ligase [Flavobacteriales bacterium]MCB9193015.1 UDP-N-acetylmuramoyl-L-alanyl-D-glutamate--2,6-diaminopimelate ligase [Flavobacteriales bacterium]